MITKFREFINKWRYGIIFWVFGNYVFGVLVGGGLSALGFFIDYRRNAKLKFEMEKSHAKIPEFLQEESPGVFTILWRIRWTLIYSVLGYYFFREFWFVLTAAGIVVDGVTEYERQKIWPLYWGDDCLITSKYWYFGIVPFCAIYTTWILLSTGTAVDGHLADKWILLTQPFFDEIAKHLPVVENYTNQMHERGESWKIARMSHLFASLWFVCGVTMPWLFFEFPRMLSIEVSGMRYIALTRLFKITLVTIFFFSWGGFLAAKLTYSGFNDMDDRTYHIIEKVAPMMICGSNALMFIFLLMTLTILITVLSRLPIIGRAKWLDNI